MKSMLSLLCLSVLVASITSIDVEMTGDYLDDSGNVITGAIPSDTQFVPQQKHVTGCNNYDLDIEIKDPVSNTYYLPSVLGWWSIRGPVTTLQVTTTVTCLHEDNVHGTDTDVHFASVAAP